MGRTMIRQDDGSGNGKRQDDYTAGRWLWNGIGSKMAPGMGRGRKLALERKGAERWLRRVAG
jgi:hypothetical protein